ncbi:MAG: anaerobic ribonucleoside-triphosphate reductase activating protein [Bacillota bacterium]|nr:anaerobic ribonucleoside-triphosphate reductase activating protein [Bacillota bacterium]
MNYAEIKNYDIANGDGVRVSLFVSGCTHHCKNCFNSETWDFNYGKPFTAEVEAEILKALEPSFINGITLLGGEPFEPQNQRGLVGFLQKVRKSFPEKTIWCYTGYTLESDLLSESRARCEVTDEMLCYIDVLVDGEFVQELYDISLAFRGSSNQRIICLKETLSSGKTVLRKEK